MSEAVTVFIPNYNGERYLVDVFESLKSQTLQDFRCVFLDDGSTDASLEIAQCYVNQLPNLEIHRYDNVGIAGNWNRAVALAKTEYFSLLHCDDCYEPDYLRAMLELMAKFPAAAIGHCSARTMDAGGQLVFSPVEQYKRAVFMPTNAFCRAGQDELQALLKGDYINCPSVMYRTSAARAIGEFNTSLRQTLDWEYWFRVVFAGFQICGTRQNLFRYRRHADNLTVQNSKDFERYEEELQTLAWAHAEGLKAGLVQGRPALGGIRKIVIADLGRALASGQFDQAERKLIFLKHRLEAGRYWTGLLNLIMTLGRPGGLAMVAAINSAVFMLMFWKNVVRICRQA